MISPRERHWSALTAICLSILIAIVSLVGILTPDFYAMETMNWQVQSLGQDFIDLLLVAPALFINGLILFRYDKNWLITQGILLYAIYTFTIYCFAVHFNKLFPVYCVILGISFFSFLFLIYKIKDLNITVEKKWVRNATGSYFIIISILFYLLWLTDIIPPILSNSVPRSVAQTGLFTNPVHTIDLAVFLPGLFIAGLLILRNRLPGIVMVPVMLTFFIVMNFTILTLNIMMVQHDLDDSTAVAGVMGVLIIVSTAMLIIFYKHAAYDKA